jgi:hypothetical protein
LQRLLVAEDARGTGRNGIAPLLEALGGGDTLLRRLAVRGLGRLQRPELGRVLLPLLTDSVPAVRGEAANAIAQSLRRSKRNEPAPDSARLGVGEAARVLTTALGRADSMVLGGLASRSGGYFPRSAAARQPARSGDALPSGHRRGARAVHRRGPGVSRAPTDSSVILLRVQPRHRPTTVRQLRSSRSPPWADSTAAVRTMRDRDGVLPPHARGAGVLGGIAAASSVRR